MTLFDYEIIPPTDVLEASISASPDDVSVAYLKIRVTNNSDNFVACQKIEFRINQPENAGDTSTRSNLLTTNAKSITPVAGKFGVWTITAPAQGEIFEAEPISESGGLEPGEATDFFLYDIEVVDTDGNTFIAVIEETFDPNDAAQIVENQTRLKIRKYFPALRIDYFKAANSTITSSGSTELSWATTSATIVELMGPDGRLLFSDITNPDRRDDSVSVAPDTTSTYTLTARRDNVDQVATKQVTISVSDQLVTNNLKVTGQVQSDLTVTGTINGNGSVPPGLIAMWSGAADQIPTGWVLCDGRGAVAGRDDSTLVVPDLRNRFIVGSGQNYQSGNTGGADSITLSVDQMPRHNHTGSTASSGTHNHPYGTRGFATNGAVGADGSFDNDNVRHTWNSGAHTHGVTINHTGNSQAHENRPPYFALAYIMKL